MSERHRPSRVVLRDTRERDIPAVVDEMMTIADWESWVPRDATVLVKPNLCVSDPEKVRGSNTHAAVAEAVCRVLQRRTRRIAVVEADHLRQKADLAFEVSGYVEMARRVGVSLVNLSDVPWRPVPSAAAGRLELPEVLLDADVFITLPVLKTHALTYFTGALKNQWGCLPQYNRILLHKRLDELLVELHRLLAPRFALMDAVVGMEGRGPTNGRPRPMDVLLASTDSVALDVTAMRLVGLDPGRARHLMLAGDAGLGRTQAQAIEVDGDWERHRTAFEPAVLDRAVAAMNYMSRYPWFVRHILERDHVFYPVRYLVQVLRRMGLLAGA